MVSKYSPLTRGSYYSLLSYLFPQKNGDSRYVPNTTHLQKETQFKAASSWPLPTQVLTLITGSGGNPGGPVTQQPPQSTTRVTVSPPVSTPPPASGGNLAKYSQCGGIGWTGSGTCVVSTNPSLIIQEEDES